MRTSELYLYDCTQQQVLQPLLRVRERKLIDRLRVWTCGLRGRTDTLEPACKNFTVGVQALARTGSAAGLVSGISTSIIAPGSAFASCKAPPNSSTRCLIPPIPTPTLPGLN